MAGFQYSEKLEREFHFQRHHGIFDPGRRMLLESLAAEASAYESPLIDVQRDPDIRLTLCLDILKYAQSPESTAYLVLFGSPAHIVGLACIYPAKEFPSVRGFLRGSLAYCGELVLGKVEQMLPLVDGAPPSTF